MKAYRKYIPDLLYLWYVITLTIPNLLLAFTEHMTPAMATANILLPLGAIGFIAAISPRLGRTVWILLPLIILAAFQIVLLGLYGRSIIAVDMFLNVVTTNSAEAGEMLGSLWPAVLTVCLLYLPSLLLSVYIIAHRLRMSDRFMTISRRISATAAGIGLVAVAICYYNQDSYAVKHDLYPVNVGYNIYLAVDRTQRTSHYEESARDYRFDAHSTHPDTLREICVLVIGETSRAENWELMGYDRHTTPHLKRRASELFIARNAYSESNTTHKAVPMLLSPVSAEDFDQNIFSSRSLITAFKEAGWSTAFISDQDPNHSFIDFFASEADTLVYTGRQGGDFDMIPVLDKLLRGGTGKQLIVMHTYGSHFNYRDRYADIDRRYVPDDYGEATSANRPQLVNAYDNTIVATDRFLDLVIRRLGHENCVSSMLYSSDHGEDIFDDGHSFLHASPLPSLHQVHVAMFAWVSPEYRRTFPSSVSAMDRNFKSMISSSRSYCPTAFGLAGISTSRTADTDRAASLTSPHYVSRQPVYLDDHNHPVALTQILDQ